MNLPERDSLTSPGESLVSVFSVVTILHVLVLTLYFLPAVAILSLGGNKKWLSCQTTQCNDMKYLLSAHPADTGGSNWAGKNYQLSTFLMVIWEPRLAGRTSRKILETGGTPLLIAMHSV